MFCRLSRKLGDIVTGVFTPVLAKHPKSLSLVDAGRARILNGTINALSRT